MTTCTIICFYNGPRRNGQEKYFDKYIETHKECLQTFKHSLDKIIFVISEDRRNDIFIEERDGITYLYRPNINFSFGGWIDGIVHFPNFDYYILQEDDYYFIKDNYDQLLIEQYNKKDCDYLVTWRDNKKDNRSVFPNTRFNGEYISTIGILSKKVYEKYNFTNFNKENIGICAINSFLKSFQKINSLDYEYNLFPYYENDIIFYGYDNEKTREENLKRIVLCCYNYYKK